MRLGNRQHVSKAQAFQSSAKLAITAVHFVGGHPTRGNALGHRVLNHRQEETRFGLEGDRRGNSGFFAALSILNPFLRDIQSTIEERETTRTCIREKNADLAIDDVSGGSTVLALDSGGMRSLFEKAGFIAGKDAVLFTEMFDDIGSQVVPYEIRIPMLAIEETLHAVGCRVSRFFGDLPAIFPQDRRDQRQQVGGAARSCLASYEKFS